MDDHPAGAVGPAAEIDRADRVRGRTRLRTRRRAAFGDRRRDGGRVGTEIHHDVVALDARRVGDEAVQIHDDAGATARFGGEHGIDAAGAHVDAPRGQGQRRIRQVQGDARRLVDRECERLRCRSAQVQRELYLLAGERLHVDRFKLVEVGRPDLHRNRGGRNPCDGRQACDSILQTGHALVSLRHQLASANEAGRWM